MPGRRWGRSSWSGCEFTGPATLRRRPASGVDRAAPGAYPSRRRSDRARVAELVDALDSGSSGRKAVEVRVFSRAPTKIKETDMAIELHEGDLPDGVRFGAAVAVDTETMGLNPHRDRLCLVQMSGGGGDVHIVRLQKGQYEAKNLKAMLAGPAVTKIFHYARFDVAALKRFLGVVPTPLYCTKIASPLARPLTDPHRP